MKDHHKNVVGFADLQTYIDELYAPANAPRQWDYLYGYLVRSCGFMSVNAAKGGADPEQFIRALSWLFALGGKLRVDVTETYVGRFPGVCYYCIVAPCVCHKTGKQPYQPMPAYKVQDERMALRKMIENEIRFRDIAINYDWIRANVSTIYPSNEILWYHSGSGLHFTKLLEELAELHQVLSKFEAGENRLENVATELADVFAWIVAIWFLVFPGRNLQEAFIDHYYEGCPVCTSFPCSCVPRKERRSGIVSLPQLRELRKSIVDLSDLLGAKNGELTELQRSIGKAIDSQDEQVAVQAVAQTRDTMETIKKTVSDVDEAGKRAVSIIDTAARLATRLLGLVEIVRHHL